MTGGPERRDESVNFSLKQLMQLEDERIAQERDAREARELASQAAREADERRERAELEARQRASAEERERARVREMEEEAHREAIQRAAIEQARITVEARTRAEESDRERRHEIELQRMRAEVVRKPGTAGYVASGIGGAAAALALALALHFGVTKPAADARVAELDRVVATADQHANSLNRRVGEQLFRIQRLEEAAREKDEELAKLRSWAAAKPALAPATGPFVRGGGGGPVKAKGNPNDGPPCANKFDPLCGHIDTH